MGEIIEKNCGLCLTHSLHDAYSFLKSLQHRGKDTTGIAAIGKERIDVIKWLGTPDKVQLEKITNIFNEINPNNYHTFIGHVRYATSGDESNPLQNAHPVVLGGTKIEHPTHIFHLDCDSIAIHNGQISLNDENNNELDTLKLLKYSNENGVKAVLNNIHGSYVLIYYNKRLNQILIARDRHGMMPAILGKKDGKYVLASEDIALRKNGANIIKTIEPGSIYSFFDDGSFNSKFIINEKPQHCFFQWNYIGNSQSNIENISVWNIRRKLGEALAKSITPDVDIVSYLPDCPEIAAMSYAEKRNLTYKEIFYKIKNDRSFQGPSNNDRSNSIRNNLHILPTIDGIPSNQFLNGKKVAIIDDSIVRGNNAKYAKDLLEKSGVKEIHLISYTPPIGIVGKDGKNRGCEFGIDMPPSDDFIARNRTCEEISNIMGMNVHFLPYDEMLEVFEKNGISKNNLCNFCIGGKHPFS